MPPKLLQVDINNAAHVNFLLLVMRDRLSEPHSNISHTSMPSPSEHGEYLRSKPHGRHNYLIKSGGWNAGHVYLSKNAEIGLYVRAAFRRERFGSWAVKQMIAIAEQQGKVPLANINPRNLVSLKFFEGLGFKVKERTDKQLVLQRNKPASRGHGTHKQDMPVGAGRKR